MNDMASGKLRKNILTPVRVEKKTEAVQLQTVRSSTSPNSQLQNNGSGKVKNQVSAGMKKSPPKNKNYQDFINQSLEVDMIQQENKVKLEQKR